MLQAELFGRASAETGTVQYRLRDTGPGSGARELCTVVDPDEYEDKRRRGAIGKRGRVSDGL